jgi:hypothetical protein
MVTVGDIEMESPVPKIQLMTNAIVVMPSDDDAALHTTILNKVFDEIKDRVAADPDTWVPVIDLVETYVKFYHETKATLAAQTFLAPLGLNHASFLAEMSNMDSALVGRISEDLVSFKLPGLSLIVAGLDKTGSDGSARSHIYEVHDGEIGCLNIIGYAAIGAGARHARAHFMLANQSSSTSIPETLWNTYFAKKRAEVAPGVGETTDIGMIGPEPGQNTIFKQEITGQLEKVFKKTAKAEKKARETASKEVTEYVEGLGQNTTQQIAAPDPAEPEGEPKASG